ncbi:CHRNA10 [Mytilus edulis]|uniref:CHRNA10 n=1 Tax=Mytilus edulis TaxID=6550 RepID=A0A8S3U3Q9_MYTED|nr:CHRNA10 [Mytilus edulis]
MVYKKWNDCRFQWNASHFDGITSLNVPYASVWVPDITLYDSAADEVMMPGRENYRATINSDGSVSYNFPTVLKSVCRIDVTYFPFDTQVCRLTFGSWSHNGFEMDVVNSATEGDLATYIEHNEWDIAAFPVIRHVLHYNCFAALTFILPPESGEKVSLGVTVLLSLAVFLLMVSEQLPASSDTYPYIENPTIIEESNDLPSFCQCASEGATEADITNKYRLHCNLTQPMEPCYDVETNLSFKSKCTDGTRKKDPLMKLTPRWHNGWNEEQAEATSREYFDRNFPIDVRVASGISIEDYINSSIEDIKITGDTAFLATTLSVMQTAAKAELVRNQSLSEQITDDGTTLLEKLSSHLCLNNCISNGQCKNGSCICNELFGGEDCATPRSTPPSNVSLPDSGLCDVRKEHVRRLTFFENTRSYKETTTAKATMINSYIVSCDLPHARQKRSTTIEIIFAQGYEISVSMMVPISDTCPSTTAITGTNEQSASEKGREDEDEINGALPIGVVAGLLILGVSIAVMIYKFKHKNIGNSQINIIGQEESDQTPTTCLDKEHSTSSMFSIRIQE